MSLRHSCKTIKLKLELHQGSKDSRWFYEAYKDNKLTLGAQHKTTETLNFKLILNF